MTESYRHQLFEPFAGTFRAEVKIWMGAEPHISTGTMVNAFVLDDRYLEQRYQGDASEGPFPTFSGHGYWGYDASLDRYQGFWIDSASSQMQMETGRVDDSGKEWTMVGEFVHPESRSIIKKRSVISLIDSNRHRMISYMPGPDGQEHKTMEIEYTRNTTGH